MMKYKLLYLTLFSTILLSCVCSRGKATQANEKAILLQQISKSIELDNRKEGYKKMQEYENKFIDNRDWMENKVNYQDYSSTDQILDAVSNAINERQFTQAFFLCKLILPAL